MKALGLHWRDRRLLAADVYRDDGRLKGVRPLGGGVEFGESAKSAVIREFKEELGVDIDVLGDCIVMENLYAHEGVTGHEILFIFDVALPDGMYDDQDHITFYEDNGAAGIARWHDLGELDLVGGPRLYPDGLKSLLIDRLQASHR